MAVVTKLAVESTDELTESIALFDSTGKAVDLLPDAKGTAVLVAGTVTVADAKITATSRIRLFLRTAGGTVGAPFVAVLTPGTGFTIKSTSNTDTSTIAYEVISYS
jgi:hypothetical protein